MNPYHLQRKICFQQGLYITGWLVQSIYRTLFPTTSKHLCSSYTNILIVSWPRHVLSLVAQCAPLLLQHLLYEALSGAPNKFASRILCRTRTTLISDFALNYMALPLMPNLKIKEIPKLSLLSQHLEQEDGEDLSERDKKE